ncbi:hypothetical protein BKI52_22355 [marine bacterium AO1-C]|nr:hypothetical protein BKI52_22355 [marine bacterium AO1-C]
MKIHHYAILLFIAAIAVLFYLSQKGILPDNPLAVSKLPKKRPKGMVIEMGNGGGMLPISKGVYISEDSCYQRNWAYRVENKTYFKLSNQELDQLYQTFVDNKFDRIRTLHSQTHDRGGTSVYLRINRKTYQVHNAGSTYIRKGSQSNFGEVVSNIKKIVAAKISPLLQDFSIQLNQEVIDLSLSGHISSPTANISKGFKQGDNIPNNITLKFLPGKHHLRISFTTKDTLTNGKKYLGGAFELNINPSTKGIRVLRDSSSVLKFEYFQ